MSDPTNHDDVSAEFDGIATKTGTIPVWWKNIFVATIAFTPFYLMYYHNGAAGRSVVDELDRSIAQNAQLMFAKVGDLVANRETLIKSTYEESWLQIGKIVFRTNCASCHARDGGGIVGPNLCDNEYKNVRDIADILRVVQDGANAGAMPAWGQKLSTNELVLVCAYVASLRGSTPANGKSAEGREIDAWPPEPEPELEAEEA